MKTQWLAALGLILCLTSLIAIAVSPCDGMRGWLAAMFLWSGIPVGSLGLLMMIRLIGGPWGHATLPVLEAGTLTWPLTLAALVPVMIGMTGLYPWASSALVGFKGWWLTPTGFGLRSLIWLGGLAAIGWALIGRRFRVGPIAIVGLIFVTVMGSLIAVDWLLSLDPEFHSSGFGLQVLVIQFQVALAAAVIVLCRFHRIRLPTLGALTLTLHMLWAYLAFTAYFVVWSGNLAGEPGWYLARGIGGWNVVIGVVAAISALSIAVLLARQVRNSLQALQVLSWAVLASKATEAAWLVLPSAGALHPLALLLFLMPALGLGLLTMTGQAWLLSRRVASRAPR